MQENEAEETRIEEEEEEPPPQEEPPNPNSDSGEVGAEGGKTSEANFFLANFSAPAPHKYQIAAPLYLSIL